MANIADFSRRADELPPQEYDLVPEGTYNVDIEKAELKDTKNGNGQYINLQLKITGPTNGGRVVFSMINIQNASPKAEEIGLRQLAELRAACGLAVLTDTDQLIGKSIRAKVGIRPASGDYQAQNTVKSYLSAGGSPMPTGNAPAPAAAGSAPPWARK